MVAMAKPAPLTEKKLTIEREIQMTGSDHQPSHHPREIDLKFKIKFELTVQNHHGA